MLDELNPPHTVVPFRLINGGRKPKRQRRPREAAALHAKIDRLMRECPELVPGVEAMLDECLRIIDEELKEW